MGKVVFPPTREVEVGDEAGEAFDGEAELVLLDELVELRPKVHVPFVNERGFTFERGPGEAIQVAELEPAFAVGVVLERGLGEAEVGGEGHY